MCHSPQSLGTSGNLPELLPSLCDGSWRAFGRPTLICRPCYNQAVMETEPQLILLTHPRYWQNTDQFAALERLSCYWVKLLFDLRFKSQDLGFKSHQAFFSLSPISIYLISIFGNLHIDCRSVTEVTERK